MANPACTFGECGQSATFTGTFFDSGLSVIVCGDHFVEFAAGTLEAMTGIPVTLLISLPPEAFAEVVDHELGEIVAPPTSPGESSEVGTARDPRRRGDNESDDNYYERMALLDSASENNSRESIAAELDAKHNEIDNTTASSTTND
jgi:hypothetical protein